MSLLHIRKVYQAIKGLSIYVCMYTCMHVCVCVYPNEAGEIFGGYETGGERYLAGMRREGEIFGGYENEA